jgi:hypothetical protein
MNSLYSSWLLDFLPGSIPDETRSTCDNCAMCADGSHITFDQKVKCCSCIPVIPNFLAGRILTERIDVFESYLPKADVRPQGVYPHNDFLVDYNERSPQFGRRIEWQCPYYLEKEGGTCGIWQNRNSGCATWFCKYLRGHISREFWTATDALLTAVEKSLSNWCVHKLEAGSVDFRDAFPIEIQEVSFGLQLRQQQYSLQSPAEIVWGKWLKREKDFFYECDNEVRNLRWNDVRSICGSGIETLKQKTLEAYVAVESDFFPDVVNMSGYQHREKSDTELLVWIDTPYDPVCITKADFRLLHRMNGLKMSEALQYIPREILQKLFDAGILI